MFECVGEPASLPDLYQMGDIEGVTVYSIHVRIN